ncbi:MAG: hypothetical protein A2V88_08285 [Elusimicrobia bacterium RBG_16_66_12]|nr:MAG: hypothetical protein A2V88_08285 [Elusimicrobia bacterium RBG_16_66_12]
MRPKQTTLESKLQAAPPPLSSPGSMTLYADTDGLVYVSVGGGPYEPLETSATAGGWFRDMALTPPQIEPDAPGDVLAFSTSALDVPAGSKVLLEGTPSATGAVLDVVATGQAGAPYPAPGGANVRLTRTRTAPAAFPAQFCSLIIEHDGFVGDAFCIDTAILLAVNNSAPGGFSEGIYIINNADGLGGFYDRALAVLDGDLWMSAYTNTPGLPASNMWLFTFANFNPGEPSGYLRLTSGDADAAAVGDVDFQAGINTTVPAGPHGSVTIASRAAAQIPFWVRAFAGQTANLQEWRDAAAFVMTAVGPAGEIRNEASGVAAGSPSSAHVWSTTTSVVTDSWTLLAEGDAGADFSDWILRDPANLPAIRVQRNRVLAPFTEIACFNGSGARATPTFGAMVDNTGAADTGTAESLTAGAWDATQVQLVEEAFASLVARINSLELKLREFGLYFIP